MARAHPYYPYRFCFGRRFDQRGRSSPAPLPLCARWDSNHGLSPWNHTPHCQLITVPVRLTNYVGRADFITIVELPKLPGTAGVPRTAQH
jgi:hypothetical protein